MGIYTGTSGNDKITPAIVTAGVESTPEGSKPSADDDEINGLGGADVLKGDGGNDTITAAGKGTLKEKEEKQSVKKRSEGKRQEKTK